MILSENKADGEIGRAAVKKETDNAPERIRKRADAPREGATMEEEKIINNAQPAEGSKPSEIPTPAEEPAAKPHKKGHLLSTLKDLCQKIAGVFREYPVTMGAIVIAAFIGTLLVTWKNNDTSIYPERACAFCLLLAMQTLLFEEFFPKKLGRRITGYGISAVLSAIFVYILSYQEKLLFGMEQDLLAEWTAKVLCVYGVVMLGLSIYHMFRRTEEDFEVYATKAFLELLKASVFYGLFALGLALIIWVFNELIFDTDELLEQVEIFLAGGIYVPMCLKAISGKNEAPGKFARFCIQYALQPLQLAAFAIIYLYIIKIFVTGDIPSNKIFPILAFLFCVGMPIWTMVHALGKDAFLHRISPFVPYAFIPFLFLQIWSLGIRISAYGMTYDRYFGIVLILLEVVYFVLYFLHHRGNKRSISWLLFVLMLTAFLTVLCPATNFEDVIIRSQMKRLTALLDQESISKGDESRIKSAYRVIDHVSRKGRQALQTKLTEAQRRQIESYDEYGDLGSTRIYLSAYRNFTKVDVSGYRMIYQFNCDRTAPKNGTMNVVIRDDESYNDEKIQIDLSDYLDWIVNTFDERYDSKFTLKERYLFHGNDQYDVYLTSISIDYNYETKEISSLDINGYLLEK